MSRPAPRGTPQPAPCRTLRSTSRRIALVLGAAVAALLLLEIGVRVYARWTLQERGLTHHDEFGWACLPNVRKRGEFWSANEPAWTNARGWRDAEVSLEPPVGTRRVVAIGDSFVFGVRVDYGERFTEVMEREVQDLEVVNLGINATGTDQQLRILELEGVAYRPDVVVVLPYLGNDLVDISYDRKNLYPKPYYRLDGDRLELVKPAIGWTTRLRGASYLVELALRPFDRGQVTTRVADEWRGRDTVPLFVALVRRMRAVAQAAGAHFLAAPVYPSERTDSGPIEVERRVRESLEAVGIPVLDTFEMFAGPTRAGEQLYAGDGHWNPGGHRRFAAALLAELRRRQWLDD